MMYPLVLGLVDDEIPVTVTCRVLCFSKQAFFKWKAAPVTRRDWDDALLINVAVDFHHDDPEFGYRFIPDELTEQGMKVSRDRVNRLCTQQRLWLVHSRKRGRNRNPGPPVHDDLVQRVTTVGARRYTTATVDNTPQDTGHRHLSSCPMAPNVMKRNI
jgi:hypothetical protein